MLPERDTRLSVSRANREVMGHVFDVVTWVGELPVVIGRTGKAADKLYYLKDLHTY